MSLPIKNPETEAVAQRIAQIWREQGLLAANAEWNAYVQANPKLSLWCAVVIKERIATLAKKEGVPA
jgi:hypothetical protein